MTAETRILALEPGELTHAWMNCRGPELVAIARYQTKLLREIDDDKWGGQNDANDWLARVKRFLETGDVPKDQP
jgi:hypothetical protein